MFLLLLVFTLLIVSCTSKDTSDSSKSKSGQRVTSATSSELKGFLTDIKVTANQYKVGDTIGVSGVFHAQADGNYYIEFGLDESSYKTLTVLQSSQSACDQSKHYAGVWANNLRDGDTVPFSLSIADYGKTGKYNVVGGVYSRCNTGADIAGINAYPIIISAVAPQISGSAGSTDNVIPLPQAPTSCAPSGYFSQLWVRQYGHSDSTDNSISKVAGVFHNAAQCTATYYIEAGMLQNSYRPLSVAPSNMGLREVGGLPSACDLNVHFSGVKVEIPANQDVYFNLYPANYGTDGRYILQGGVFYNKGYFCGNADIASFPAQEITFTGFAQSAVDNSWVKVI